MRRCYQLTITLITSIVLLHAMLNTVAASARNTESMVNTDTSESIVRTDITYSYEIMQQDIEMLAERYPNAITYMTIGQTEFGRDLYAVRLGHGNTSIFINASHHGREWITTILVMNMLEAYAKAFEDRSTYLEYDVYNLLKDVSIWFVPMVNPDGVTLQQFGLSAFPKETWESLIRMNNGSNDFSSWKANASGIDLNRQYPADWENIIYNHAVPSFKNHKGSIPLQTLETKALVDFTYRIDPEIAVAYHSSGEILYWYFHNKSENIERDYEITEHLAALTGYEPVKPRPNPSGGGYTDWFIQEFDRPGFTPEVGKYVEEQQVSLDAYSEIWRQNQEVGLYLAEKAYQLRLERQSSCDCEESLHVFRETAFYSEPTHRSVLEGVLNKGTWLSKRKYGDWYLIVIPPPSTDHAAEDIVSAHNIPQGEYWVHESEVLSSKIGIESVDMKLTLFDETVLYDAPITNRIREGSLRPQTVRAVRHHKDWFQINTWIGEKWIQPKRYHIGEIVQKCTVLELTEKTPMYNLPFADLPSAGQLAPQIVKSFEQIGEWHHIDTWIGKKWIFVPSTSPAPHC